MRRPGDKRARLCLLAGLLGCGGCGGTDVIGDVRVRMSFARAGFYDAPFPSDDLRKANGSVDLSRFPNPAHTPFVAQILDLITRDARGFGRTTGVYLSLTDEIAASELPDLAGSAAAGASVFLFDVGAGTRTPAVIEFTVDGGPFGATNQLSLLPLQGIPLRASALYAAVVRKSVHDRLGHPLAVAPELAALIAGNAPVGLSGAALDHYRAALVALAAAGVPATEIAGLGVFSTDDSEAGMKLFADDMNARPLPAPAQPFAASDLYDGYCVYNSTVDLYDYQQGTAPYARKGGDWQLDANGKPLPPHMEKAGIVVTVPRRPMPATGYPTVIFIQTGAGGTRPLVDRGVHATAGGPAIAPGTGPAEDFAAVGWAAITVDLALENLRNPDGGATNEDFNIFNVFNPAALRDNVRESALELLLVARITAALEVDATTCAGAGGHVRFDKDKLALFGHSMGASIAPLALAFSPAYRAVILSGAGGSYIENVMWKKQPLEVKFFAEALLGYQSDQRSLTESDPALSLVQWAAEPSDTQVYAHRIIREPDPGSPSRHVLMEQGIVDHYILPRIANTLTLSLGLDLAGPPLDATNAFEIADSQTPIVPLLPLVGRSAITLPASGNVAAPTAHVTAVVVQHAGDGIEDGHEVIFQTEAPKHQYRCFLDGLAQGKTPVVPPDGKVGDACP